MNKDRAIHELRLMVMDLSQLIEPASGEHARIPAAIVDAHKLIHATDHFVPDMATLKEWEAERFRERGWSESPTQGI